MTRLELLHIIQKNAEQLTVYDAFALTASRLPDDTALRSAWHVFIAAYLKARAAA